MTLLATSVLPVFVWSLVLIAIVVAGLLVVTLVKKRIQQPDEPISIGFSLEDLRQMYKDGKLSTEEFERAKQKLLQGVQQFQPHSEKSRGQG